MKIFLRLFVITVLLINVSMISAQNFGPTYTLVVDPKSHTLDENRNGNYVWTQLKGNLKYEVSVSGEAFVGNQKIKGFFVYFVNNKEDGFAERYLFIKPGDKFYMNVGGDRPFILAFIVKFYGNRAAFRGKFILTVKPVGREQAPTSYNEEDMYRGIR